MSNFSLLLADYSGYLNFGNLPIFSLLVVFYLDEWNLFIFTCLFINKHSALFSADYLSMPMLFLWWWGFWWVAELPPSCCSSSWSSGSSLKLDLRAFRAWVVAILMSLYFCYLPYFSCVLLRWLPRSYSSFWFLTELLLLSFRQFLFDWLSAEIFWLKSWSSRWIF